MPTPGNPNRTTTPPRRLSRRHPARGGPRQLATRLAVSALVLAATAACSGGGSGGDALDPLGAQHGLEFGRLCTLLELCSEHAQPMQACIAALYPTGPTPPDDDAAAPDKPSQGSSDDPPPVDPCTARAAAWASCLSDQLELTCATEDLPDACADHAERWPNETCGPAPALLHRLTTHD